MSTETSCHFHHLLQFPKKVSLKSDFIEFFHDFIMHTALGQGQTAPRGQSFVVKRNVLPFHSFVTSLKKNSLKSDFIHFSHDLIHVYSPGADSLQGTKF